MSIDILYEINFPDGRCWSTTPLYSQAVDAAKAKAKHSEAVREAAAELPAAEFVRETMEPKRHRTPEGGAKRERLEDEVDRDLVIRRILEEFMA